jgi:hypothetical protein
MLEKIDGIDNSSDKSYNHFQLLLKTTGARNETTTAELSLVAMDWLRAYCSSHDSWMLREYTAEQPDIQHIPPTAETST